MIIYNVTVKVAADKHSEWLQWMREEHIPAMLQTGLFVNYRMSRLLEQDDTEGPTYSVQYFTDSFENYETFKTTHAQGLRQRGYDVFGDRFIAFTTVMQEV
ncbi:DUF4286 family protein [Chitinophaga nivalis]|uniref:DUF4286 family protein n=1 Tax=Chitinophaga nivalis TaxID=2991709 RepID=A0ABT3IVS1_9BACT|nr:DUF4286 family protein [Chitinophaga nivalis]MCW3462269.1 DUF4286 family protein [Chitinophaga nivalis]MCW3488039.1 DUF4286 family protein [Chitinophaga nivalis]